MTQKIVSVAARPTVLTLVILYISLSFPGAEGMEGNLFYLSFMNISTDKAEPQKGIQEIFITSFKNGRVKIQFNSPLNYTEIVQLNETNNRQYVKRILPRDLASRLNTQLNVAIVVSAEMDISVQVNKAETGTGDGYLALPITAQSRKFYLASYSRLPPMDSLFSILSPYNDTCVSVSYVNGNTGYRMMHLTLQQNDAFHGGAPDFDYTGVYITSSRPIAVYSGHSCAMVPVGVLRCDHLIEQIPPITQWGRSFIVSSFWGRDWLAGFRIRVVAERITNVTYTYQVFDPTNNNGPASWTVLPTVSIDRGQWHEAAFENITGRSPIVLMINCTENCLVMQYSTSYEILGPTNDIGEGNKALPDPFMITGLPLDHYQNNIRFSTSRQFRNETDYECINGITIVAKKTDIAGIFLDGIPILSIGGTLYNISVTNWTDYAVLIAPLKVGFHSVTAANPNVVYAVYVYGYGTYFPTAYGYLGGYKYLYGANDQKIDESYPLFDFSLPSSVATSTPAPPTFPTESPPIIADSDTPYYVLRYTGRYYAFNLEGNLITKFCSDGYARYFREKRLEIMKTKVRQYITQYCSRPGGSIAATADSLIYSEYTAGVIEITVRVKGSGDVRLRDIITCVKQSGLMNYFENLANWVDRYNNSREVLKNDTDYTKDCHVVHFLPEKFLNAGLGWGCPRGTQAVVSSSTLANQNLLFCLLVAVMMTWFSDRWRLMTNPE